MNTDATRMGDHRDRKVVLAILGVPLLFVGAAAALIGPYEIYAFYLFSDGGRFHYEGFGFGSFMFANIGWQILGYYCIALLLIPLGYGHLRLRRWARVFMLGLIWCWLIVGLPLLLVFVFMLSVKVLSPAAWVVVVLVLGLSYFLVPAMLIRFYSSRDIKQTFELNDRRSYWVETLPMPVLVMTIVFGFYLVVLHVPLFFNGLFPVFGRWIADIAGVAAWDICIVTLALLMWGVLRRRIWAWRGSTIYFALLTASTTSTLLRSSLGDILSFMRFPPTEMALLKDVPLHGAHFAPLVGLPLLATLTLVVMSKRYFGLPTPN